MAVTFDYGPIWGAVRTTGGTATAVPGLLWTPTDKTLDIYDIQAWAVQENSANPLRYHVWKRYRVGFTAGAVAVDDNAAQLLELGDAAWDAQIVTAGAPPTQTQVKVTGAVGTNLQWYVQVTRFVLTSN